jgi:hypothetical protein
VQLLHLERRAFSLGLQSPLLQGLEVDP